MVTRSFRIRAYPKGTERRLLDLCFGAARWPWNTFLEIRSEAYRVNAARNVLAEGLRQLAGCDDRDLCVDARGSCPEEGFLGQVLAEEARSGHRNRAC